MARTVRPHANNRGELNSGLRTLARKRWIQQRQDDLKPFTEEIRTAVSKLNDGKPSKTAWNTYGEIVRQLKQRATENSADFRVILTSILQEELEKAQATLTGNTQQRTLDTISAITAVVEEPALV